MGFNLDSLRPENGSSYASKGMTGTVFSHDSQKRLRVFWENPADKNDIMSGDDPYLFLSKVFSNKDPEILVLPEVFTSLGDIKDRQLRIVFQKGPLSLERFSQLIFGLQLFGSLLDPRVRTRVRAKVWNDSPHGTNPKARFVWVKDAYVGIKHLNAANNNPSSLNRVGKLTAAFSWEVEVTDGQSREELIFPIADLEVPYDDKERLKRVAQRLALNGFSGSLIRSGDFTHYMGNFLLQKKFCSQVVGKLMSILTPQHDEEAQYYANQLYMATSNKMS